MLLLLLSLLVLWLNLASEEVNTARVQHPLTTEADRRACYPRWGSDPDQRRACYPRWGSDPDERRACYPRWGSDPDERRACYPRWGSDPDPSDPELMVLTAGPWAVINELSHDGSRDRIRGWGVKNKFKSVWILLEYTL